MKKTITGLMLICFCIAIMADGAKSVQDTTFELEVSSGSITNMQAVNKFGRNTNADSGVVTDIWDSTTQPIWLAPTSARIHTIVSADAGDNTGTSTLTLTGLPLDTETVTIGTKVYTYQTVLTDSDGNILIGATASDSLDNLISAISLGAGAGTTYATSTTANLVDITGVAGAGDTMLLFDNSAANIATTEALTNGVWSGGTATSAGAKTIRIWGLTSWDLAEVSEDVALHGATSVNTVNSYVIIHRIKVLNFGTSGPNIGIITATADIDATITAQINANQGQTQMAIYGIPSTQCAYVSNYYTSAIKKAASLSAGIALLVNPIPDSITTGFLVKNTLGLTTEGSNYVKHKFSPLFKITGPAIIKIQVDTSADNTDMSAGFDLVLINN